MITQAMTTISPQTFKSINNKVTPERVSLLSRLVSEGKLKVVIDKEYAISELPQAHAYSETGRAKGKLVVAVH